MSYQKKLMRFCNKKTCQSFGHIVAPADRRYYPVESEPTFFDEEDTKSLNRKYTIKKTKQERREYRQLRKIIDKKTSYPNYYEQYLRIRPLDWVSQKFYKKGEKRYLYRGRSVVSSYKEPLNFWTESDDKMVDAIVQRLIDGDTTRPISTCKLPTLGELFRNYIDKESL